MKEKFISHSVSETESIAQGFAARLKPGDGVLYKGEMGAGKTYFTKGIARFFKTHDEVTSPTFALINEYYGDIGIFHFDLFRISDFDELYAIGFYDYFDRNGVFCIEWSENIPGIADEFEAAYEVSIVKTGAQDREITVEKIK